VREVVDALVPGTPVHEVVVATAAQVEASGFPGSPTVRVDGRDVDPVDTKPTMACRVYPKGEGMPDRWRIEAAILRVLRPKHILFLCVANSARSQLAEGIARSLAPEGVKVSSAGSEPTQVRPQAIRVLEEIGIDISNHRSKSVNDIDPATVEAVITLCAEEVCPVFLGKALRAHWGLPDPAGAQGDEQIVLEAFRTTRDELRRRLAVLFEGWQ
jgi:arsenate reductase